MIKGVFALLALLGIVGASIWALVTIVGLQGSLIWTALAGFIAWAVKQTIEQQKERRRLLAAEKREQYLKFMDFMNEFFTSTGQGATEDASPERLRELRRWSLHLALIGSDDVVRAWNKVRLTGASNEGTETLRLNGQLWLAMRKDCGHHDTSLSVSDMLAAIVNDVELHRDKLDRPPVSE